MTKEQWQSEVAALMLEDLIEIIQEENEGQWFIPLDIAQDVSKRYDNYLLYNSPIVQPKTIYRSIVESPEELPKVEQEAVIGIHYYDPGSGWEDLIACSIPFIVIGTIIYLLVLFFSWLF